MSNFFHTSPHLLVLPVEGKAQALRPEAGMYLDKIPVNEIYEYPLSVVLCERDKRQQSKQHPNF